VESAPELQCRCRHKPYILTGEFAHDSLVDWIGEKLVTACGVCVFTVIALRYPMRPNVARSMKPIARCLTRVSHLTREVSPCRHLSGPSKPAHAKIARPLRTAADICTPALHSRTTSPMAGGTGAKNRARHATNFTQEFILAIPVRIYRFAYLCLIVLPLAVGLVLAFI
jgi:hypothetical protein